MSSGYTNMQQEALTQIRLDARHGIPPMDGEDLKQLCHETLLTPDDVRAVEKEGRALREAGVRCLCSYCEANSDAIGGKERLRRHYAARRHAQLQDSGLDFMQRDRLIQDEINAGAALQLGQAVITHTKGQQP